MPEASKTIVAKVPKKKKAEHVRLEFLRFEILRKADKGWDMYFLFGMEDPANSKKQITILCPPDGPIDLTKRDDNVVTFTGGKKGAEGLTILEAPMPDDRRINMSVRAYQSKGKARRNAGGVAKITDFLDDEVASKLAGAAASNPYVAGGIVLNKGINFVAGMIAETKDKERGYASIEERFGDEFDERKMQPRLVDFVGGDIRARFRWTIE